MTTATAAVVLLVAAMLGVVVPYALMRMLVPALAEGRLSENYRGAKVFAGLGVVWLVWAGCAIAGGFVAAWVSGGDSSLVLLTLAGPLALIAFALGLVDDAFGTAGSKGFRGHLTAFARGRITTGGLKLLGISLASYVAALVITQASGWSGADSALSYALALPVGAAVALTANFVNLTDLRPGRALKVYVVLALAGTVSAAAGLGRLMSADLGTIGVEGIAFLFFLLGPVLAVWRYDLGEQGMLGDAGANAMGVVAGLFIVSGLPLWAVLAYLAFVFALNLVSERVSYSAVIERVGWLSAIDRLGRKSDEGPS